MAYRGYKYRLYPDNEARAYFARCFGAMRYCYNYCVREYDAASAAGVQLSGFDIAARLREHLQDVKWMADVDYEIKEFAPKRFDNAMMKYKRHEANRPREHKKGERPELSYTTAGIIKVDFKHDLVQLPKIGILRARLHRTFDGEITSATVKREADGNYYISLTVSSDDTAAPMKPHTEAGTVGVDVGLRHLATLSNGDFIELPDMQRIVARIQFLKKRLERQKLGSKRYYRTKLQIARLHHHQANITKDTHHKAAAKLCNGYDTICMETLNVAGMKRGQRGEKTAADIAFNAQLRRAALASLIDRVRQKAADTGTNFVTVDRFEPTTKTCHVCGYVLNDIDLDTKEWTCPECHTHHDRDVNAAINIRNRGIEQLQASQPKATHKEQLPLAEGNVKSAKKATAGCDLRTEKMTGKSGPKIKSQLHRQPKAQIADGAAPPRIFNIPLPSDHPFRYFKLHTLGNMAGVPFSIIKKCVEGSMFIDPPEEYREQVIKLLKTIKSVADSLRQLRMTDDAPEYTKLMLGKMNKVARVDWIIKKEIHFGCTFTSFRAKRLRPYEITIINKAATVDFPNRLDVMADKYLQPFLPPPVQEQKPKPLKVKKPLRRERKNDPMIVPLDDPILISYEGQILTILHEYFISHQCHICQDTLHKIVGKGTLYRPENCTHTRMATFISALYDIANTLAGLGTTVEGQKERLAQLFYIKGQYVKLDEIVARYIGYENSRFKIYFKRAGTIAPTFFNNHYIEIMRVIAYKLPALIRESAIYLTNVYHINE